MGIHFSPKQLFHMIPYGHALNPKANWVRLQRKINRHSEAFLVDTDILKLGGWLFTVQAHLVYHSSGVILVHVRNAMGNIQEYIKQLDRNIRRKKKKKEHKLREEISTIQAPPACVDDMVGKRE